MEATIDTYKGWEIRFDTERETFLRDIDDSRSVKKSYSAIKNFIKEWVKENQTFKQFKIQGNPSEFAEKEIITIIGKHGNGNLLYMDGDKPRQLSSYDRGNYMIYTDENKSNWKLIEELSKEMDALNLRFKEAKSKFVVKSVKEYCKENDI